MYLICNDGIKLDINNNFLKQSNKLKNIIIDEFFISFNSSIIIKLIDFIESKLILTNDNINYDDICLLLLISNYLEMDGITDLLGKYIYNTYFQKND